MPVLHVIEPHGFCSGVKAAAEAAAKALDSRQDGAGGVYCLHELVHNSIVVEGLRARGMVFVDSLSEVPRGATVLFSAHGVSPAVRAEAESRGLDVVDATCPFVTRVHREVRAYVQDGQPVVIIGNAGHAEVAGTAGEAPPELVHVVNSAADVAALPDFPGGAAGVVAQTTLGTDDVEAVLSALRARFGGLRTSPAASVCYATRDRQRAVREYVRSAPGPCGVVVLGSPESSNTRRLAETARAAGAAFTALAGDMAGLSALDLPELGFFGVTSGASTPEEFLESAVAALRDRIEGGCR